MGPVDLVAAHVYWPAEAARRLGISCPRSLLDSSPELVKALDKDVRGQLQRLPDGISLRVQLVLGLGHTGTHLVQAAEEAAVELLVVGSHQRKGLGKLVSVSHHALRSARLAVASIPAREEPLAAAREDQTLATALVATDFSEVGNRALPYALRSTGPHGKVYLLHVSPEPLSPAKRQALSRKLLNLAAPEAGDAQRRILPEIVSGKVSECILQAAERHDVDVICLGSHGHKGVTKALLGSVARTVLSRTRRPVLVIQAPC